MNDIKVGVKNLLFTIGFVFLAVALGAQDVKGKKVDMGTFSGGFTANANVFLRDSLIGAFDIPQYDNQLFGTEAWFNLNYRRSGYNLRVRYDMFNNSNLFNPSDSYTAQGIGFWLIEKQMKKLGISVGYIYDQIGSGIIYRAFEQRPQLIDSALKGAKLTYKINDAWNAKIFAGRQKFLFGNNPSTLRGASLEGFKKLGGEDSNLSIAPGVGFVNRTLDEETVTKLVGIVKNYVGDDRIELTYNVNLYTFYNTLTAGRFNLYTELAYKTPDAFRPDAFNSTNRLYVRESGKVYYASLGYAQKGLGITVEGKRTENFDIRTDPTFDRNVGLVNFIPPMNRLNTYRLTSRYSPATQLLSEQAAQIDIRYALKKNLSLYLNASNITNTDRTLDLYNEIYLEVLYKKKRKWQLKTGVQLQRYNQEVYEGKTEAPIVETVTPFVDFLYKISRKKSIRIEGQYMSTGAKNYKTSIPGDSISLGHDFGDWLYSLVEIGLAPHWSFEGSVMYNIKPGFESPTDPNADPSIEPIRRSKLKLAYPTLGFVYTNKSNRYAMKYVKQVEGVVCSGGICRLEPAFSGIRMSLSSTF